METGPLPIWLWHGLDALGLPVDCIHARHVAAALSLQVNKTDADDAHGIAQVVRSGWYRAVAVKRLQSCRVRSSDVCRRMALVPGIGASTSLTFVTTIDDPTGFQRSGDVGAYLGLTAKRYQSG